jgi:hypothetical protein
MAPIEFRASSASAVRTHRRHDVGDVVDLQLREGESSRRSSWSGACSYSWASRLLGFKTRWLGLLFAIEHTVMFWVQLRLRGWDSGRLELMLFAAGIMLFLAGPGKAAIDKES